jgi:hypothetical protein
MGVVDDLLESGVQLSPGQGGGFKLQKRLQLPDGGYATSGQALEVTTHVVYGGEQNDAVSTEFQAQLPSNIIFYGMTAVLSMPAIGQ